MSELSTAEQKELILRDLQETVGEEELSEIVSERPLRLYWGTATTGRPHLGYFVPVLKLGDFLKAGCEVTVLFADLHAFLDNMKSTWELLEARTEYYEFLIKEMLSLVDVPLDKLRFVVGTDFQLQEKYTLDMYRGAALASLRDVKKAGAEVVKQSESPLLSSMLYPILQALDEEYLEVDAQFGGVDQRKIFMFAREYLPKLGYKKRIHLMNPLVPGLGKSGKMSSSEPNSKIELDDSAEVIQEKLNKAFSVDKEVEGNGILAILKYVVFRKLEQDQSPFVVQRPEKWGGDIEYSSYQELEKDFVAGDLSSVDLKPAVAKSIDEFIAPLRSAIYEKSELISRAYPE